MVFHDNLQQVLEKVETGEIITKVLRDREYTQKIRYQLVRYYWQRFSQDLLVTGSRYRWRYRGVLSHRHGGSR
jgi:hypothetical protein